MESHHVSERPETVRSATWPPANMSIPEIKVTPPDSPDSEAFEADLEEHPERHFLSPVTADEVYGWDSDTDDDSDDDGEWSAGIVDFSLFSADRKRAMETGQALDGKWDSFISNQTEAFERSVERVRESKANDVPALTPDTSPELKDNLEDDIETEDRTMVMPQIKVPNYLTVEVKPAGVDGKGAAMLGPDDDLPLYLAFARKQRIERPGLKHTRTMSGKKHVWRRPGDDMFTVGEDVDGEEEAEREEENDLRLVASTGVLDVGAS